MSFAKRRPCPRPNGQDRALSVEAIRTRASWHGRAARRIGLVTAALTCSSLITLLGCTSDSGSKFEGQACTRTSECIGELICQAGVCALPSHDVGPNDARSEDAALDDSGPGDASLNDARLDDAGSEDAGPRDSGAEDVRSS